MDPLVTSGRQVKRKIRLDEWVPNIVETLAPTFDADAIALQVRHSGPTTDGFEANVVPGMVVQVASNLLDNARYWVKRRRLEEPTFRPVVVVEIDGRKREVRFSDNGPGVATGMRRTIFEAFVTTKPPGAGSGLGLFISSEIARYSGAELTLLDAEDTAPGMSATFVLRFPKGTR